MAEGQVKVLDFGLAKVQKPTAGASEEAPTLTVSATQVGIILGTAAYMSPEQASGKPSSFALPQWRATIGAGCAAAG
jgi:serine/threonine protein kinase